MSDAPRDGDCWSDAVMLTGSPATAFAGRRLWASSSDAIASLLIGILLAITAVGLARPLADLLIGRSLAPSRLQKARSIIEHSPAIDHLLNLYALHAAPQEAILAARVHPTAGRSGEQLAQLLDELDQRLRRELPEIGEVFIDITAHLRPTTMEAS